MPTATKYTGPVSTEKTSEGAIAVSAIVDGALRRIRYYGYTKKQAIAAFRVEVLSR